MTAKVRKRDLRTRVTELTYRAVERYATAHALSLYAATEQLLMLGVSGLNYENEAGARLQSILDSVDGRLSELVKLTDRTLYSATVAYAYARHGAVSHLPDTQREALEPEIAADGQAAYRRQRDQALGGL